MKPTKAKAAGVWEGAAGFQENQPDWIDTRIVARPPLPTQSLLAAIDRLIARALCLAFFDLDYSAEIELARRLAVWAERRVGA